MKMNEKNCEECKYLITRNNDTPICKWAGEDPFIYEKCPIFDFDKPIKCCLKLSVCKMNGRQKIDNTIKIGTVCCNCEDD